MGGKSGKKNELDQKDVESRKIIHAPGERKIGVKAGIWRYMGMMHVPRSCTAGRKWSKTDSSRSVWSLEKFDCAPGGKKLAQKSGSGAISDFYMYLGAALGGEIGQKISCTRSGLNLERAPTLRGAKNRREGLDLVLCGDDACTSELHWGAKVVKN